MLSSLMFSATVDIKPDVPLAVEPLSPLDLRTDLRMLGPGSDPGLWERQLQQELLLIQKQQQIQKQLLISEFQKQHEKLTRQHQAQLQEHLKVSIARSTCMEVSAAPYTLAQHKTTECNTAGHSADTEENCIPQDNITKRSKRETTQQDLMLSNTIQLSTSLVFTGRRRFVHRREKKQQKKETREFL